jgi:3-deoxy-manno-octulosonate cytidylyltransferase (CMP-KDO synthetase)
MGKTKPAIVMIPSRLGSSRLPGKPLAKIGDAPMIVQVWRRAMEANVGRVVVACGDFEIADVVLAAGGEAVMTSSDLPSGSDRIFEALEKIDPEGAFGKVVNLQGDLPNIDPTTVARVLEPLKNPEVHIATLAAKIIDEEERHDPNVVKVVAGLGDSVPIARCLYFTRATAPAGKGDLWHHIGIYAYQRSALAKFVGLRPSALEAREKLEQLRALEAGMRIDVARVGLLPLGVDTPADLEKVRLLFNG